MVAQLQDARHIDALTSSFDESLPHMDEVDRQEIHNEHYRKFEVKFPELLYRSFIVAIYSIFESQSTAVLKHAVKSGRVRGIKAPPLRFELEGLKDFLKEHCHILVRDFHTWESITKIATVRNCIVHANGMPKLMKNPKDEASLKHQATIENNGIDMRGSEMKIGRDCFINSHKAVLGFFDELYSALGYEKSY